MDKFLTIVGDFHAHLLIVNRTSRKKIIRDREYRENASNQFDLIDIYRKCHSTAAKYTIFSSSNETARFQTLSYKTCINKFLKEFKSYTVCCLFTLVLNQISVTEEYLRNPPNIWKLNNTLLNNLCLKEYIKTEIRKYFVLNEIVSH